MQSREEPEGSPMAKGVMCPEPIEAEGNGSLSNKLLGGAFLGAAMLLLSFTIFFVMFVTKTLIQPSSLLSDLSESYVKTLTDVADAPSVTADEQAAQSRERQSLLQIDANTVNLLVILEYANADIRAASAQIAFALVAGCFFEVLGILMFAAGHAGAVKIGGKSSTGQVRFAAEAPGVVALVLGGVIIAYGVGRDLNRPIRAEVTKATGISVKNDPKLVPGTGNGENPQDKPKTDDH